MITITDLAAEKLKKVLDEEGKSHWGIRLYIAGGGCCASYGLDLAENSSENDKVIEKNGIRLFVDKESMPAVSGMTIDYVDDGMRQGFILSGGQSSCGPSCTSC